MPPSPVLARRAARRLVNAVRSAPPAAAPERYDSWLRDVAGEELQAIDQQLAGLGRPPTPGDLALFRDLDVDLWGLLLTQQHDVFPSIKAALPLAPDPTLQELWNGASGARLAQQSANFYAKVSRRFAEHADVALTDARVLDYGCGWGRLTRFFARDVAPGALHGCDPVETILDVCRQSRLPAQLTKTEFVPSSLPYDEPFDLAFAFSVFTHISESSHHACLAALHGAIKPGGILVVTVRPPAYLELSELMASKRVGLPLDWASRPDYLFVPHAAEESHLQYEDGEMHYGEAIVTLPYVRERWAPHFELLEVDVLLGDLHQVALTLRRAA